MLNSLGMKSLDHSSTTPIEELGAQSPMRVLLFLGADVLMEAACSIVSFLVAYYAFRAYRFLGEGFFKLLYLGFLALGSAMLFRASSIPVLVKLAPPLAVQAIKAASWIVEGVRALSYALFIAAYVKRAEGRGERALAALLLLIVPTIELLCVFMLIYLVAHLSMLLASSRNLDLALVLLGFACLLAGHVLFLASAAAPALYLAGHLAQLVGSAMFLAMLVRVARTR